MEATLIPYDILVAVFDCVVQEPYSPQEQINKFPFAPPPLPWVDIRTVVAISQVCKRWREAALATSVCWSTIMVDFDAIDDIMEKGNKEAQMQALKVEEYMKRAGNRPLTLIIRNDLAEIYPSLLPTDVFQILDKAIKRSTRVFFRFVFPELGHTILDMLSDMPNLEHLSLWQIRDFELYSMLGYLPKDKWRQIGWPSTLLRSAPRLRTFHMRGLRYPNSTHGSLELPLIEDVVVRDASVWPISWMHWRSFIPAFMHTTSLTLLFTSYHRGLINAPFVLFPTLECLEMDINAMHSLLAFTLRFKAPVLANLCIHPGHLDSFDCSDLLPGLKETLSSSSAPSKSLIIHGFTSKVTRSLMKCLELMSAFDFVDCLVFRDCVFHFSPAWDTVWRPALAGSWNWDELADMEFNESLSGEITSVGIDGQSVHEQKFTTSLEAGSPPSSHMEHQSLSSDGPKEEIQDSAVASPSPVGAPLLPAPRSLDPRNLACFMPTLQGIAFKGCSLPDKQRASSFAEALAIRQKTILAKHDDSTPLDRIEIVNSAGSGVVCFVDHLRSFEVMAGVQISYRDDKWGVGVKPRLS